MARCQIHLRAFKKRAEQPPELKRPCQLAQILQTKELGPKYDFDAWMAPVVAATGTSPGVKMVKKNNFGAFREVFRPF